MTNTTRAAQRKAKLRFALLYFVSLSLLFFVMSAFWRKLAPAEENSAAPQTAEREQYIVQTDSLLHQRMERLDAVYANAVEGKQRGQDASAALAAVRRDFSSSLDSLDQQASFLDDGPKRQALQLVSQKFRKAFNDRERIVTAVFALPKLQASQTASTVAPTEPNTEVEDLKRQLQEKDSRIAALVTASEQAGTGAVTQQLSDKDKAIAALQAQLKQKENALQAALQNRPAAPASGGGEWQQKYLSMKGSYEKAAASEKSLRTAYQALADDNRRLLSQIQAQRKN